MALRLTQLRKAYVSPDGQSVPVIDVESFDLAGEEQVALVGGSGTGKTTLLHLIAGILAPDSGQIHFNVPNDQSHVDGSGGQRGFWARNWPYVLTLGTPILFYHFLRSAGQSDVPLVGRAPVERESVDLAALTEADRDVFRGRHVGYIFQTHHLLPGFTALENVLLGMSFTGRSPDKAWARHLLEEVGLSNRLDYKPEKLSVGQQQRVAAARALANRPRLVLADEPTGALDPKTAQQVLDLVRRLCKEIGASLLLVSHDPTISQQFPRVVELAKLNKASVV